MKKIALLSDLWGKEKSEYVEFYQDILCPHFEVQFYDSCVLGEVDKSEYEAELLHQQFIRSGIEKAVKSFSDLGAEFDLIAGFSVGGTIAWKTGLNLKGCPPIVAISASRIRFEKYKPTAPVLTFWGSDDSYNPNESWFRKQSVLPVMYQNEGHEFYRKKEYAEKISKAMYRMLNGKTDEQKGFF